jgi:hypothetical protein
LQLWCYCRAEGQILVLITINGCSIGERRFYVYYDNSYLRGREGIIGESFKPEKKDLEKK